MPIKESKIYEKVAGELGTLADGIHIHAAEPKFPPSLEEQDVRDQKKELEDARKAFEKAQSTADQRHKEFEDVLKAKKEFIASAQRTIQGHYSLHSQLQKDFGFTPPKPSGKKGKRTPKT